MKTTVAVAILALALSAAGTAFGATFSTHALSDNRVGKSKPELQAQIDYSKRVERFITKHHWMIAARHADCWSHVPWARTCNRARHLLAAHRWLQHVAERKMSRLFPPAPLIPAWLVADFTCIHHYEGAWTDDTGNGYYGGLQMDIAFQRLYGAEFLARFGTANAWPIIDQLLAAARAYQSGRGFGPWPNTARACGLL